jgi:PST family polysaccharide transporter
MVPVCIISVNYGFWPLVYTRAFIKLDLIIPEIIVIWIICGISPKETFKTMWHPAIATTVMSVVAIALRMVSSGIIWSFISIFICVIVYFTVLFLFKPEREKLLASVIGKIKKFKQ